MTDPNDGEGGRGASWRDRKRRATEERIAACAISLFLDQGFEGTTVEAVAEAAGVSRRSFFDYFRTKEEVLFAWQSALPPRVRLSILAWPADGGPVDAARDALFDIAGRYDRAIEALIARLGDASERVQAGHFSGLMRLEQALADGLKERWPEPAQATRLAVVAMAAVWALRLAIDRWVADPDAQTLRHHLEAVFDASGTEPFAPG